MYSYAHNFMKNYHKDYISVSKTPFNIACNSTKNNVMNEKTTFPSYLVSRPTDVTDEYNEGEEVDENNDHLSIISTLSIITKLQCT